MAKKEFITFAPKTEWGKALQKWHSRLAENRGDRAALKKCNSLTQVVFVPAYHELYQDITAIGKAASEAKAITWQWEKLEDRIRNNLPIIASLTALVEPPEKPAGGTQAGKGAIRLPRQMGTIRSSGGGPVVSDLRFRRLLKCRTPDELYPALRRVLGLLKNQKLQPNLMSLAQSVFYWGENVRKRWAYDYYATETHATEQMTKEGSAS